MAIISCPQCGKKISDMKPQCTGCGLPIVEDFYAKKMECEYCGSWNDKTSTVCGSCGAPLPEQVIEASVEKKKEAREYPRLPVLEVDFENDYRMIYDNGHMKIYDHKGVLFDNDVTEMRILEVRKTFFGFGYMAVYIPGKRLCRDWKCYREKDFEACEQIYEDYKLRKS